MQFTVVDFSNKLYLVPPHATSNDKKSAFKTKRVQAELARERG